MLNPQERKRRRSKQRGQGFISEGKWKGILQRMQHRKVAEEFRALQGRLEDGPSLDSAVVIALDKNDFAHIGYWVRAKIEQPDLPLEEPCKSP